MSDDVDVSIVFSLDMWDARDLTGSLNLPVIHFLIWRFVVFQRWWWYAFRSRRFDWCSGGKVICSLLTKKAGHIFMILRSLNLKKFAWTKFRENGQNTRKSRKLIHAKFNPLKVHTILFELLTSEQLALFAKFQLIIRRTLINASAPDFPGFRRGTLRQKIRAPQQRG